MELTASKLDSTILGYLKEDRLLREGHFEYRSGRHSQVLLDRDRLLADSQAASRMGYALAKAFFTRKIDTVATPSVWGAGLAQWVAYFLEPRAKVVYATPMPDGSRQIAENLLDLIDGKRVLLIDNLMLSGETMAAFDAQVTKLGGNVLGIGCLWVGGDMPDHDGEVMGLLNDRYPSYDPDRCPLCQEGHEPLEVVPY
jgi:orotate phosphoribosyltransferase